ncbi:hypothetical protein HK102_007404 [Quaeritorhiza haematococci]|nr:hypothetical protein HK102_007404 [Quaeritorhiza haematococci]
MFGNLQSKQFPPYFTLQTITSGILTWTTARLAGIHSLTPVIEAATSPSVLLSGSGPAQVVLMAAAVGASVSNLVYWGPVSTRVMFERHRLEKAGKDVPPELNTRFSWLHGISSLCNLVVVAACTANCVWIGAKLAA